MNEHFHRSKTIITALVTLAGVASSAGAQQIVGFGAAEWSPNGRNLQLLGAAVSSGRPGWSPVFTITGLRFEFPINLATDETADAFAIAPSLGVRYQTETWSTGVHVGYSFVDEDEDAALVTGSPVGGDDGVFVTAQHDYWGRGERIGQLFATYNFGAEYLWSRAKGAIRFPSVTSPLFLGAEAILQGGGDDDGIPAFDDMWILQAGPVLAFQLTPNFRIDLSGGVWVPIEDPGDEGTGGYGRIEFVAVLPRLFR